MNERQKKAFDFASDLTKQLITLSTGIVTITLLFSKDIFGPKGLAVSAWVAYLLSTVFGLWTLMALTGTLAPAKDATLADADVVIGPNARIPSGLQVIAFGVATVLTLLYVILAFSQSAPPANLPPCGPV